MSGGDDVGSEEEAWVWLAVEVKKVTVEEREREGGRHLQLDESR